MKPRNDYATPGAYFVTICTFRKQPSPGVAEERTVVSDTGRIVQQCWTDLPTHYRHTRLDCFIVMPNHIHGIAWIRDAGRAGFKPAPTALPEIMRGFKTFSARRVNELRGTPSVPLWQRNYHERIIRDGVELHRVREYIVANPGRWADDPEHVSTLAAV